MKIVQTECCLLDLSLNESYSVAYGDFHHLSNAFLRIETDDGMVGWGCGAPDEMVTGETAEGILEAFGKSIEPILHGANLRHYIELHEQVHVSLKNQPSAHAMVDMAIYDLLAQRANLPLYQWLGGFRKSIETSITVGLLPIMETLEKAQEYQRQGFRILKIKGGLDVNEDIEKMKRLREILPPETALRFDANQGYHVQDALHFMEQTLDCRIELLEQPTPRDEEDALGHLTGVKSIPVMADESLLTLKDVFRITRNDRVNLINIKLQKVGGITESLHINSVARSAGVEVMFGCMDESALGIAAGLHVALARPNIIYADLDGHFDLINDPFANLIPCRDGILYPPDAPGLGVPANFEPDSLKLTN
jgi:L-Ala-D/L-Glu epimerase